MLKVWGRKTSSNVQALMWAVGELGLAVERLDVGHRYGGNDTSEFLAMNPNGTVPVLQDGKSEPIWETGVILRYLANRYSRGAFWPDELAQRTHVDKWAEWSKINIAMNFTGPIFWRAVRTAPAERDPIAIAAAVSALTKKLVIAEKRLAGGRYLAGDEFSLADIQFGHVLFRYFDLNIERADLPALRHYYDHLTQRPAFREHVMVSYDELRVL